MLILYSKPGCGYSGNVRDKLEELGLSFEEKSIMDFDVLQELVDRGGKKQTPYFVDEEHEIEMYDSDAINDYLDKTYSAYDKKNT